MGVKHKKTRKEKIIADYRHNIYSLENQNISPVKPIVVTATTNAASNPYPHVISDISKTAILTIFIIIGELILFFLLKNHIIILPKISYEERNRV